MKQVLPRFFNPTFDIREYGIGTVDLFEESN